MSGRSSFISRPWRLLRWAGLAAAVPALWACTSRTLEAPIVTPTQAVTQKVTQKINSNIDILFMIDNSSSMTSMQTKLIAQLPIFMQVLAALPMGLPSVHVAVVSSDMGAPSDNPIGCSNTGDDGKFYTAPEGTCTSNDFNTPTDLFITDDAAGTTKNFSDPDNGTGAGLSKVFSCIALLGAAGCGFEHQLASIDRALGSDGQGGPTDPNFLRTDAYLGIVMLTNEDDCSAPPSNSPEPIYSLEGGDNTLTGPGAGPGGPLGNYRCNGVPYGGHKCQDTTPGSPDMTTVQQPPLFEPADAIANADTANFSNCVPDDDSSSALIPVSQFVKDIQSLKPDPLNQILVAAVTGVNHTDPMHPNTIVPNSPVLTPTPYNVNWAVPMSGPSTAIGEKIPNVNHLCSISDGSFADPAVRISAFVNAFASNGVLASICDSSYSSSMAAIAAKIGALISPKCISGTIQLDASGNPNCTVINEFKINGSPTQLTKTIPSCVSNGGAAPCWQFLAATDMNNKCTSAGLGQALSVSTDPMNATPDSLDSLIQCETCVAGVPTAGCACLGTAADVAGCI